MGNYYPRKTVLEILEATQGPYRLISNTYSEAIYSHFLCSLVRQHDIGYTRLIQPFISFQDNSKRIPLFCT